MFLPVRYCLIVSSHHIFINPLSRWITDHITRTVWNAVFVILSWLKNASGRTERSTAASTITSCSSFTFLSKYDFQGSQCPSMCWMQERSISEWHGLQTEGCSSPFLFSIWNLYFQAGLVFHVECHSCTLCGRHLSPGEQILVDDTMMTVSCMIHYPPMEETVCGSRSEVPSCSADPAIAPYSIDESFSTFQVKKVSSICRNLCRFSIQEVDAYGYNFEHYSFSDFCDDDSRMLKRRGPRTTIKQNQVESRKTFLQLNIWLLAGRSQWNVRQHTEAVEACESKARPRDGTQHACDPGVVPKPT